MSRQVRITAVQYQLRPIRSFEEFAHQVEFFVDVAQDYRSHFVCFPEFLTCQLLSLIKGETAHRAVRRLAQEYTEPFIELMSNLAQRYERYIVGGTHPTFQGSGLHNTAYLFTPDGLALTQEKIHLTPAEKTYWDFTPGQTLRVFDTPLGKVAILICYDVEFPEAARAVVDQGAEIIFVPSCTDDRQGFLRVRYCAQARAIENQIYVVNTGTIGNLPQVDYLSTNYGQAAILTPSDFPFARDGIAAEGTANIEMTVTADLNLELIHQNRNEGSVLPYMDRRPDVYDRVDVIGVQCPPSPSPSSLQEI